MSINKLVRQIILEDNHLVESKTDKINDYLKKTSFYSYPETDNTVDDYSDDSGEVLRQLTKKNKEFINFSTDELKKLSKELKSKGEHERHKCLEVYLAVEKVLRDY